MENNTVSNPAAKSMQKAGMIVEKKTAPTLPPSKEEEKKAALEKLNEQLRAMLASFHENKYTQVNFKTTPLDKREFFKNLNNPYTASPYNGKSNTALSAVAGTLLSYGVFKATEYNARAGILGYTTTAGGTTNWADPLAMNSTVPLSLYNAYTNPDSKLPKSNLGTIAGACMLTNTMIGDGIYDSIDKVPAAARSLMAVIGLYGNLNPTIIPLADKGNQYGMVNSVASGLNVSPDSVSLFALANLILRHKKIGYLYNTAIGKMTEKPKEDTVTGGSWMQNGTGCTGVVWKF